MTFYDDNSIYIGSCDYTPDCRDYDTSTSDCDHSIDCDCDLYDH